MLRDSHDYRVSHVAMIGDDHAKATIGAADEAISQAALPLDASPLLSSNSQSRVISESPLYRHTGVWTTAVWSCGLKS
jgi:hypothetical protein